MTFFLKSRAMLMLFLSEVQLLGVGGQLGFGKVQQV